MPADVLIPIGAAAKYWHRGDKALANFRLVFSDLPHLRDPSDADRLNLAETLLDQGLSPRGLMKKLNLDPAPLDLRKYSPDQPRVPAGNGRDSGRWGFGPSGQGLIRLGDIVISRMKPPRARIAAKGPLVPDGLHIEQAPEIDPLDPEQLNDLPSLQEQHVIADTLNVIRTGTPDDIKRLGPHPYKNFPSKITGAFLPPSAEGYITYDVPFGGGRGRGASRLIIDQTTKSVYYTNTHYLSFYNIMINEKK